jgi:hypothetical protein
MVKEVCDIHAMVKEVCSGTLCEGGLWYPVGEWLCLPQCTIKSFSAQAILVRYVKEVCSGALW